MKKSNRLAITGLLCALSFLFEWAQWFLFVRLDALFPTIVPTLFCYAVLLLRVVLFGALLVHSAICFFMEFKQSILRAILPLFIVVLTVFLQFIFPLTDAYLRLDCKINMNVRKEVVEMFKNGEIEHYRYSTDKYALPVHLCLASYDARIITGGKSGEPYICFKPYTFGNASIVYTENEQALCADAFVKEHTSFAENWYLVRYE